MAKYSIFWLIMGENVAIPRSLPRAGFGIWPNGGEQRKTRLLLKSNQLKVRNFTQAHWSGLRGKSAELFVRLSDSALHSHSWLNFSVSCTLSVCHFELKAFQIHSKIKNSCRDLTERYDSLHVGLRPIIVYHISQRAWCHWEGAAWGQLPGNRM